MAFVRASVIVLALGLAGGAARADLVGARESSCQIKVELAGPIATVTETHDLVAEPDGAEVEAIYDLALPPGAAVIAVRVTPPGGAESTSFAVSSGSLDTETPDAERLGISPDLSVVRWKGSDGDADHYELRAAPLEPRRALRAVVTWMVPVRYADGRMVLHVPARGDADVMAVCRVTVRAGAGAGVRSFGPAYIDGVQVPSSGGSAQSEPTRALEVELVPAWSGDKPVAASAGFAVAGAGERALTTVAVYLPPPRPDAKLAPKRLVVLVDTSRSLGAEGRAAALTIADALIGAVPPATPVEVIAFDREPRRLFTGWRPAKDARAAAARALKATTPAGGSDLGAALNLAATVVADGDPAAIVIVTDGMLPTRVDGAELIGHAMMPVSQVTIDAIVPLVPGAPLLERGALDALATAFHGQVIALRTTEVARRAAKLPRELASAPPLRDLTVTIDGWPVPVVFPDEIVPGDGAITHVLASGRPGKQVRVAGTRSADAVAIDAVALPAGTAPIAIAAASGGGIGLGDTDALGDDALLALGRAHHTVTASTALAVIDTSTATGAARAEFARTSGLFTRTTPAGRHTGTEPVVRIGEPHVEKDTNLPDSTYQYLIKYQLWPQLRACYQDALRGKAPFGGTLDLTLELARGEVSDVKVGGTPMPEGLIACVAAVAYAIEVPEYPLSGLAETIAVVHKPVILRPPIDADAEVDLSDGFGFEEPPPPPLE